MGEALMLVAALGVVVWSFTHRPETPVVVEEVVAVEEPANFAPGPVDEFEVMCAAMENCR